MSNYPPPSLVAGTVYRFAERRRGTVPFDSLIIEILNSLSVENNEVTQEDQEHKKEWMEAKFQEKDVVLAINKFIEQKGRRPFLMEFCEFIQNWEGMPTRKKSFDKLINENIEFRQENRGVRDEIRIVRDENRVVKEENRTVNNNKRAVEIENRALKDENRTLRNVNTAVEERCRALQEKLNRHERHSDQFHF